MVADGQERNPGGTEAKAGQNVRKPMNAEI
jgi:hypothetical protein